VLDSSQGRGLNGKTLLPPPTEVAKAPSAFINSVKLIGATAFRFFQIAALWAQTIAALL